MTVHPFPEAKQHQVLGMLQAHRNEDDRELVEVLNWAWLDGYRSIVGLHDRAVHILEHGRGKP